MDYKVLLTSKTAWLGVASIAYGIFLCVTGDGSNGARSISEGLALVFLRDAISKAGTSAE